MCCRYTIWERWARWDSNPRNFRWNRVTPVITLVHQCYRLLSRSHRTLSHPSPARVCVDMSMFTMRRNGETRTHDPLVPNQVRYQLRHIPLLAGVPFVLRLPLLIEQRAHRMRSTLRKVIPSAFRYLWERWFVVGDAVWRADRNTHYIKLCARLGCDPIRDPPITAVGLAMEPRQGKFNGRRG